MLRHIAPFRLPVIGVAFPFSLLCASAFALPSDQVFWGISFNIWGVFLCAPVTSLCLRYCRSELEGTSASLEKSKHAPSEGNII